jgi:hypothetical protein
MLVARMSAVAVVVGLLLGFASEAQAQPPVRKKGTTVQVTPKPVTVKPIGSTGVAGITPVTGTKGAIVYPYNPFNPMQNLFPLSGQNPYLNPYLSNSLMNPFQTSPFMSPYMTNPLSMSPFMMNSYPYMPTNPFMMNPMGFNQFANPFGAMYPANPFQNPMNPFQPGMQNPFLPGVQPAGGAFGF